MTPRPHWVRAAFAVALLFFVHEALLRGLRIDGVRPDILLGAGIVAAVVGGPELGALMAFVLEALGDLFVNTPFGLSALVACTVAFLAGSVRSTLGTHARYAVPVLTFLGSIAAVVLWALVGTVLGLPALLHPHLVTVALVIATVNLVVCAPLALLMQWVAPSSALTSSDRGIAA
jgi:rod shape-determining protein MreD